MTIPGVLTHINLLHSAVWAVIQNPPPPPSPCDWMPGPVLGLMGAGRGQCKAGNGGSKAPSWWWPAAWKAHSHPSRQSLSSRVRQPGSGWESMSVCVCEQKCSLLSGCCEVNTADCFDYRLCHSSSERERERVLYWFVSGCVKVEK